VICIKCNEISSGTYECSYSIYLPWKCKFDWEDESERVLKCVAIDKCLLPEILSLWKQGIKTTGCCCGHGRLEPFIGVRDEYIDKMKELGYKVHFNKCRPNDEDSFVPKTNLTYGKVPYIKF